MCLPIFERRLQQQLVETTGIPYLRALQGFLDAARTLPALAVRASTLRLLQHETPQLRFHGLHVLEARPDTTLLPDAWSVHAAAQEAPSDFSDLGWKDGPLRAHLHGIAILALRASAAGGQAWLVGMLRAENSAELPVTLKEDLLKLLQEVPGGGAWSEVKEQVLRLWREPELRPLIAGTAARAGDVQVRERIERWLEEHLEDPDRAKERHVAVPLLHALVHLESPSSFAMFHRLTSEERHWKSTDLLQSLELASRDRTQDTVTELLHSEEDPLAALLSVPLRPTLLVKESLGLILDSVQEELELRLPSASPDDPVGARLRLEAAIALLARIEEQSFLQLMRKRGQAGLRDAMVTWLQTRVVPIEGRGRDGIDRAAWLLCLAKIDPGAASGVLRHWLSLESTGEWCLLFSIREATWVRDDSLLSELTAATQALLPEARSRVGYDLAALLAASGRVDELVRLLLPARSLIPTLLDSLLQEQRSLSPGSLSSLKQQATSEDWPSAMQALLLLGLFQRSEVAALAAAALDQRATLNEEEFQASGGPAVLDAMRLAGGAAAAAFDRLLPRLDPPIASKLVATVMLAIDKFRAEPLLLSRMGATDQVDLLRRSAGADSTPPLHEAAVARLACLLEDRLGLTGPAAFNAPVAPVLEALDDQALAEVMGGLTEKSQQKIKDAAGSTGTAASWSDFRFEAIRAITHSDPSAAVEVLETALLDPDASHRQRYVALLIKVNPERAREAMLRAAPAAPEGLVEAMAAAIGPDGVPFLLDQLRSHEVERQVAACALTSQAVVADDGEPSALITELTRLRRRGGPRVFAEATSALLRLEAAEATQTALRELEAAQTFDDRSWLTRVVLMRGKAGVAGGPMPRWVDRLAKVLAEEPILLHVAYGEVTDARNKAARTTR